MTVRPLTPVRAVFAAGWLVSVWAAYRAVLFAMKDGQR